MMTFDELWEQLVSLQGTVFHTSRGMPFTYTVNGGVLRISRKKNPITRATVELAYNTVVAAVEADGQINGPKGLRCFGASYLYPIFCHTGLIRTNCVDDHARKTINRIEGHMETTPVDDHTKEERTMARTKGSKNKAKALTLDEQIAAAEARVEELHAKLNAAEEELKALVSLRDEEAIKELMTAIAASGKSVSDVIAMVKGE